MPTDAETQILAGIAAIQTDTGNIKEEQERGRRATEKVADGLGEVKTEQTIGFGEIRAEIATITATHTAHREETNRRFGEVEADVGVAHTRITAFKTENAGASTKEKALAGGGFAALLLERVATYLGFGGGGS